MVMRSLRRSFSGVLLASGSELLQYPEQGGGVGIKVLSPGAFADTGEPQSHTDLNLKSLTVVPQALVAEIRNVAV
jgi:hypothetical protein